MPDLLPIDLENGILLPAYRLNLGGGLELTCDPNLFSVQLEIELQRFYRREKELLETGEHEQARMELIEIAYKLVHPSNPAITREQLGGFRTSTLGWILRFFENPSAALSSLRQIAQVKAQAQGLDSQAEDEGSTSPTPTSAASSSPQSGSTTQTTPEPRSLRRRSGASSSKRSRAA